MAQIIEFSSHKSQSSPGLLLNGNLVGHILSLHPEKAKRFQCGGFFLGGKTIHAIVTEKAQLTVLQAALDRGDLIDVTEQLSKLGADERAKLIIGGSEMDNVSVVDTGKKSYLYRNADGYLCAACTDDPELQKQIEEKALTEKKIVLPPGMDDPEKYLLRVDKIAVQA